MYKSLFIIILIIGWAQLLTAQPLPMDVHGQYQSGNNKPPGGGAPIGGGTLILVGMGVVYALSKKKFKFKNTTNEIFPITPALNLVCRQQGSGKMDSYYDTNIYSNPFLFAPLSDCASQAGKQKERITETKTEPSQGVA